MSLFDAKVKNLEGEDEEYTELEQLRKNFEPDAEQKKIFDQHPNLDLTSDIEKELIFQKKLTIAVKNPSKYLEEKEEVMKELGKAVNKKFADVYTDIIKYSTREEAKEMALKASKTEFELGKKKIDAKYPERIDKGIENKLLFELSQKIIDKNK